MSVQGLSLSMVCPVQCLSVLRLSHPTFVCPGFVHPTFVLVPFNTVLNFTAEIYFFLLTEKRYLYILKISSTIFFSNLISILECKFFSSNLLKRNLYQLYRGKISIKFADRKVLSVKLIEDSFNFVERKIFP